MIASDALMRLLIPDGKIDEVAESLSLSKSQIYQERRAYGKERGQTGARNVVARLDIIAELALSHAPEAVRLLGNRYLTLHRNWLRPCGDVTEGDLQGSLAWAAKEVGHAMAALIEGDNVKACEVAVAKATERLEETLEILKALKAQG
jgi:hypothetical protein